MNKPKSASGSRWVVVALLLIFFAPVLTAIFLVQSGWSPASHTNRGELIAPPQQLQPGTLNPVGEDGDGQALRGTWTLLQLWPTACDGDCQALMDELGRVHLALNKDMDRVTRALILPDGVPMPELADAVRGFSVAAGTLEEWGAGAGGVQLLDPRGYRMMRYPLPLDASGLLNDLEHLLRLSDEEQERRMAGEEVAQ
ncbi:hypothetical protein [Alkalilimnicola sp. S0819]|uniref:hypothetical protein n=1 Tax=Alkalilimnicola sp. S0819 TaxID=2613922 RepID=UPI0012615DB9|nr:hypothetical protein [Alkalilimnicola sp. S0819]KAB7624439.1 hypothetical protein F3N43_06445 [Alkalilimnicola sp. S0819]MPQ16272.1 hypothetical protein [Alkalilimnicola sp. S0819]